jgi:membrane protease YdiL (CAAX protease family)
MHKVAIAIYAACWGASTAYLAYAGAEWALAAAILTIFGLILSPIALLMTRNGSPIVGDVRKPRGESLVLLGYIAFYAFVLFGPVYGWLKDALPDGQIEEGALFLFKLLVHVALPSALIYAMRGSLASLWRARVGRGRVVLCLLLFSAVLMALNAVVSPSLARLAEVRPDLGSQIGWIALSWIWMSLVAGLCEEYLFRGLLQTRLAAWTGSAMLAIALASLLFGLVHAPGLYLRGDAETFGHSPDVLQVMAYSIAVLSPVGLFFGVLWHRTRSLLLVVVVHGAMDALPFAAPLAKLFTAAS